MVVLNSRDWYGKVWLPKNTRPQKQPCNNHRLKNRPLNYWYNMKCPKIYLRWWSSAGTCSKWQVVHTIWCNHCWSCASKLHTQRRKSPRQNLTVKQCSFTQLHTKVTQNLWNTFSLYNCHSRLEICIEVGEWETNVYMYCHYDWILVMW